MADTADDAQPVRLTGERNPELQRIGVLLINLGTPDSPDRADVRRYLRQFLGDPRVLDISRTARALLLHLVILPFRPRKSAAQYAAVWTQAGSPLLVETRALGAAVAAELGPRYVVEVGMRYGQPSIPSGLDSLLASGVTRIVLVPLFPQYASSSTGSALECAYHHLAGRWNVASVQTVAPFYAAPGFTRAVADVARPYLDDFAPDHVLMSYHGLPERQIRKSDESGRFCLARENCCDSMGRANANCYRAQCFATSRAVATELGLQADEYTVSFQSRLGRDPWVEPYTDEVLPELAKSGVSKLAVLCPSFVADCLETLEEIGIRERARWTAAGGGELCLIPCLNASPAWVGALSDMVRLSDMEPDEAGALGNQAGQAPEEKEVP